MRMTSKNPKSATIQIGDQQLRVWGITIDTTDMRRVGEHYVSGELIYTCDLEAVNGVPISKAEYERIGRELGVLA